MKSAKGLIPETFEILFDEAVTTQASIKPLCSFITENKDSVGDGFQVIHLIKQNEKLFLVEAWYNQDSILDDLEYDQRILFEKSIKDL